MRPGELGTGLDAAESLDRLAIVPLRGLAFREQRPRTREDAQPPIVLADVSRLGQPLERFAGNPSLAGPRRGLDDLSQRPSRGPQLRRLLAGLPGLRQSLLIASKGDVHDRG